MSKLFIYVHCILISMYSFFLYQERKVNKGFNPIINNNIYHILTNYNWNYIHNVMSLHGEN